MVLACTSRVNLRTYKKSHNPTVAQMGGGGGGGVDGSLPWVLGSVFRKDFDYDRKSLICSTRRGVYCIELAKPKSGAPLLLLELIYFLK